MANTQVLFQDKPYKIKPAKTIGIISDTHIPKRAKKLPKAIMAIFENVDYIIHAGDIVELEVIDELEQIAPVLAVHGNMDGPHVSGALPKINSMNIFDYKIGVTHDPGLMFGLNKIRNITKQHNFNVLVFGHTHQPTIKWEGKTLYVNPGSPTNPNYPFLNKPTVALLKITKEKVIPQIINL